jgi:hypothetical protein
MICSISGSHCGDYEEHGLVGYNAVSFGEGLTFRRNISPPSSGSKSKLSKKPAEANGKLTTQRTIIFLVKYEVLTATCSCWFLGWFTLRP